MEVAEMLRLVLPSGCRDGCVAVLTAYFDDSGTHAGSPVVVMGGLFGNDPQWRELEARWREILAAPGDGWERLSRFHMFDCVHGEGEFLSKSQGARDHLIYRLHNLILETGLHGYSMAVSRADWEELVVGDNLAGWGDAERFCVMTCILKTLEWAEQRSVETEVAFIFDNRPERTDANQRVFSIYQNYAATKPANPKPVGISFLNSETIIPLQAADMFAWESYRYAQKWGVHRGKTKPSAHFLHFLKSGRFQGQMATRPDIERVVASVEPGSEREEIIAHLADYFRSCPADYAPLRADVQRMIDRRRPA